LGQTRMTTEGIQRAIKRVRALEPEPQVSVIDTALAELKDAIAAKQSDGVQQAALVRELMASDMGVGEWSLARLVRSAAKGSRGGGKRVRPKRSARASAEARVTKAPITPVPAIAPIIAQSAANATPTPAKPPKVDLNKTGSSRDF